jgi:hypothetical protein
MAKKELNYLSSDQRVEYIEELVAQHIREYLIHSRFLTASPRSGISPGMNDCRIIIAPARSSAELRHESAPWTAWRINVHNP